jgi:hypothetical protein
VKKTLIFLLISKQIISLWLYEIWLNLEIIFTRCIFIATPFRLNRRSCLLSESGNASIPTFDLFSQQIVSIGRYVLSIYLLIAIFSDWNHRWRNTICIQEIEIRSYVISLGDDDFIFSAQKYLLHIYAIPRRKISKTWCFSSNMSIKTYYTTILRQ